MDGGIPIIKLPQKGASEVIVAHELLHFRHRLMGFTTDFAIQGDTPSGFTGTSLLNWLFYNIEEPIVHEQFSPFLKGAKLHDPIVDVFARQFVRDVILQQSLSEHWQENLAATYFIIKLRSEDATVQAEVNNLYRDKGWNWAHSTGERMYLWVKQAEKHNELILTPDEQDHLFVQCANICLKRVAALSLHHEAHEKNHRSITIWVLK